jgi:hypothetical protein
MSKTTKLATFMMASILAVAFGLSSIASPTTEVASPSNFETSITSVATSGNTDFDDYITLQDDRLAWIDLTVSCTDADTNGTVDEFVVLLKRQVNDSWNAYLSGTDWDTATANNPYTEDLATISWNDDASARIFVGAAYAVAFQASAGTAVVDTITVRGSVGYE